MSQIVAEVLRVLSDELRDNSIIVLVRLDCAGKQNSRPATEQLFRRNEGMHASDESNTLGNDIIHISEVEPLYATQPADRAQFNPSSYASVAAHIANNGDPPIRFGLGPGARRL